MSLQQIFLLVFSVGLLQFVFCDESNGPIFNTNLGRIQGSLMTSDGGIQFSAFRGIPYAKPPVKKLRFKEPQPNGPWNGLLDATEDGSICIQFDFLSKLLTGDEDCLYLNVYTPMTASQESTHALPVMVWIHGGGFLSGSGVSSLYGPQRLLDKRGIVLVSINYRLGPLGFLSTLDENSPGNYGLLDQVLALKWVKDNIAAFGGDPNQVTIFGESAGSASVGLHLLSPLSTGLFHSAIAQSGSVLSNWVTPYDETVSLDLTKDMARQLRCPTEDYKAMMKCLTRLPALDLVVTAGKQFAQSIQSGCNIKSFKVVVDKSRGPSAFLPDTPSNLVANKPLNSVPIMTGVVQNEGVFFLELCGDGSPDLSTFDKNKLPNILKTTMPSLVKNEEQWKGLPEEIISTYFKNAVETDPYEKIVATSNFLGDCFLTYKVDVLNEILSKYDLPIYVYKLTYRGEYSIIRKAPKDMISHVDDLQYLFRCAYLESTNLTGEDKIMSDIMLTLWTNFAKTRVPSLEGSALNHPAINFEPLTPSNPKYLNLNLAPVMVDGHLSSDYNLLKNAHLRHHKDEL